MPSGSSSLDLTFREIGATVRRRYWILAFITLFFVVLGATWASLSVPVFQSVTRIVVQGRSASNPYGSQNDPISQFSIPNPTDDIATQAELLQSPEILRQAFDFANVPVSLEAGPEVEVKQVGSTSVLQIEVRSTNPPDCAKLAEAIPAVYRDYVSFNLRQELINAVQFLEGRVAEEKSGLKALEKQLEDFRQAQGLVSIQAEGTQRLERANQAELQYRHADAEVLADKDFLDSLLKERATMPPLVPSQTTDPLRAQIEAQRSEVARLQAQLAALLTKYSPDHEQVVALQAQIDGLKEYLVEVEKDPVRQVQSTNPLRPLLDQRIAEARAALQASLGRKSRMKRWADMTRLDVEALNRLSRTETDLQRRIDESLKSVALLTTNLEELRLRRNAVRNPVQSISPTTRPVQVKPNLVLILSVSVFLGLLLGSLAMFGLEALDTKITNAIQAEQVLGAPVLGFVPFTRRKDPLASGRGELEPFRMIWANLGFDRSDVPPAIAVTSAVQGEGKSRVASNLAIVSAAQGRRVILVDADLHRPSLDTFFGLPNTSGLVSVMGGTSTLDEALQATKFPGLTVLPVGAGLDGATPLRPETLRPIVGDLLTRADLVIFDVPPTLPTADAHIVSSLLNGVLFVVYAGKTRVREARLAAKFLAQARVPILGIAFNAARDSTVEPPDDYYVMPALGAGEA